MFVFVSNFIVLFLIALFYLKYAQKKKILDISSFGNTNGITTIKSGGIIFIPAILLYLLFFYDQVDSNLTCFTIATLILAVVSFIDDLKRLSVRTRMFFHFLATTIAFWDFGIFNNISLIIILTIFGYYILCVGYLNISNFMDGINGMAFLNALCCYCTLYIINTFLIHFTDSNFISVLIIATIVFGYFNFRKKPKCFLGDVGSITIGFTIVFFVLQLYLVSKNILVFLILVIYSLDGGCTIIERLLRKENIFKSHLRHLYEIFAHELKIPHLYISLLYFFCQAILNIFVYYSIKNTYKSSIVFVVLLALLSLLYCVVKIRAYNRIKTE